MITHTITHHSHDGRIIDIWVENPIAPKERYIGTAPWPWIAEEDRERAKLAFALALMRESDAPVRYQLDIALHGGHWTVETLWRRLPSEDLPMLGISKTFNSVVGNLSTRERQIAKLLPEMTTKEIARALDISTSTVESFRGRIGIKVKLSGNELIAWCSEHHEFL